MGIFNRIFDYNTEDSFVNDIRRKRFDTLKGYFEILVKQRGKIKILDIGGNFQFWQNVDWTNPDCEFYLLNLVQSEIPPGYDNFHSIVGNALDMPYKYGDFDIVFSNSVIEHMGSKQAQEQFAKAVKKISSFYIVQTPSVWFPLEPHCRIPLFQFIPHKVRALFIMAFSINYFPRQRTYSKALAVSRSTIMFSKDRFHQLFPDAEIFTEKLFGIPKSYIAVNKINEGISG